MIPRYWPTGTLPPRPHLPGHDRPPARPPHPRTAWNEGAWPMLAPWLWGVDLFNRGYFWEAHEAWEELWVAQPRASQPATMLQGLIQIAAALVKIRLGAPDPARSLARRGLEKLERAGTVTPVMMGLDLGRVHQAFTHYFHPLEERILPPLDASVPRLRLADAPCR